MPGTNPIKCNLYGKDQFVLPGKAISLQPSTAFKLGSLATEESRKALSVNRYMMNSFRSNSFDSSSFASLPFWCNSKILEQHVLMQSFNSMEFITVLVWCFWAGATITQFHTLFPAFAVSPLRSLSPCPVPREWLVDWPTSGRWFLFVKRSNFQITYYRTFITHPGCWKIIIKPASHTQKVSRATFSSKNHIYWDIISICILLLYL